MEDALLIEFKNDLWLYGNRYYNFHPRIARGATIRCLLFPTSDDYFFALPLAFFFLWKDGTGQGLSSCTQMRPRSETSISLVRAGAFPNVLCRGCRCVFLEIKRGIGKL